MRPNCCVVCTLVGASIALGCFRSAAAAEPTWKAGVAVRKITPDVPLWLAGYAARTHPGEDTLHDLWVKALVLEDAEGHRAVVVTSDLLGFPKQMYETISKRLAEECDLPRASVMLTASHTHSGPVLNGSLVDCYPLDDQQRQHIDQYSARLEATVVESVKAAIGQLAPATLSAGSGNATFAVNRRTYRGRDVPPIEQRTAELEGPHDHSVPVLMVHSADGSLLAVTFGYACHNTTLADYQWCGDYAGFAQLDVEHKHPGTVAMFYSGCGADQNPLPRRQIELCRQYGGLLARAVEDVIDGPARPLTPRLATAFEFAQLPLQPLPTRQELDALARGEDYRARWAQRMLEETASNKPLVHSYPYPVQVWKLGSDQLWIALGGEVVVDYAIMLKRKYGNQTWVAGYANDVMAYIPSKRVWEEGGYEAGAFQVYGLPSAGWADGVESRIGDSVEGLVRKVNSACDVNANATLNDNSK